MKIFKFFLFTITIATLSACSSDDGPASVELTNENLAGSFAITFYQGSSETTVQATDGSIVVTESDTYFGETFTNAIVTFNADGTYSLMGSYVEVYTVTVTGQAPETNEEIVMLDESGTYSVDNTSRTINLDGGIVDVTLFDGTNLYFTGNYSETFGDFTETGQFEYRMVKQ
ncbi:hypothetical protein RM697_07645 [Ichthyenterobacterium sp. W332]|uniref:Lipocalin-like domain-containing protein n=1 Tax=Microcosmobacter mediterraneus TaxID=3075607 RepID=A0ABU2YK26_9FLAO|nr:hypothetical protein [Ichthyenterobacterium sp. W332]MDT0558513.1 hypothetical protein [Ichthyenterobacterium sp. W332]